MKLKAFNAALLLSSLLGYLSWGNNQHVFLWEAEKEILSKLFTNPQSVIHPFILLPLAGQLLLLITLFQKKPGKWLTIGGVLLLAVLFLFLLFIGLVSLHPGIVISVLPFFGISTAILLQLIRHQ